MNRWFTLFKKELLEMVRNFKWIWVPITFMILGVMDPLASYYMPQILDAVGGLPDGTVLEIPYPTAPQSLLMSIGEFDTLGVLIIALITMGIVAGERKSGVAGLILVKPVPFSFYITAKWAGACLIVWVSYFMGMLASWYYTGILFGWIPFMEFLQGLVVYGIWLTFIMTLTLFYSAIFRSGGLAGFFAIASAIVLNLVSGALSHVLEWSPALIMDYVSQFFLSGTFPEATFPALIIAISGIGLFIVLSIVIFRKKELAE